MPDHLAIALGHVGNGAEAAEVAARGYQLAARSVEAAPLVFGLNEFHVEALILGGYQSEAEAETRRWARQTAEIPAVYGAYAASIIGRTELSAGRVRSAVAWLDKALGGLRHFNNTRYLPVGICRSDLVIALTLSGDLAAATEALGALDADAKPFGFQKSRFDLADAWVSSAHGAITEAVAKCWRGAEAAQRLGHGAQEVRCLQTATRFGDHTTADRLNELRAIVDGPRASGAATHATALAAHDPEALMGSSQRLEQAGDVLAAADAAAHAATTYRRQHRRGPALSAQERAHRLAQLCEGATTPALREIAGARPLTTRQREIFAVADQGLTNRQIAERLGVSVRTVEGHRFRARDR